MTALPVYRAVVNGEVVYVGRPVRRIVEGKTKDETAIEAYEDATK